MALNNLTLRTGYPKYEYNLPLLVLMHGWDSLTIADDVIDRLSQSGCFVAAVGMRGRGGADGARDASGREIYDIYDAILKIRADYPTRISDKVAICGWSGGGGNVYGALSKFPDTFTVGVSNFGMSDYGYDGTYGWYQQSGGYQAAIATSVGGTPAVVPNNYHSRYAIEGIINFTGGELFMVHDTGDVTVNYNHSTRIKDVLDGAAMTNYTFLSSTTTDAVRYLHAMTYNGAAQRQAEATWLPVVKSQAAWTIPASGTINVMGYIVTKRFTIWLDSGVTSAATVVYDTAAGTYAVTPLTTANIAVSITQGTLTATGTANAGGTTNFTVS